MGSKRSFRSDERAIEGLPIRLVIALVVGVAALGIMMNMLGGIGSPGQTEVRVEYPNGAVVETTDSARLSSFEVDVVGEDGQPVPEAQVIVSAGTAEFSGTATGQTNADGSVTLDISSVDLRSDQTKGTLTIEVVPPSDSDWADEQSNTEIVVVEG